MEETTLPLHAAVALAGCAFVAADALAARLPRLRRLLPVPIVAGLAAAGLLALPRALGWGGLGVPDTGTGVDFLVGLLTANMGLHLTPRVLRQGLPVFGLFLLAGITLFGLQLLAALPFALLSAPGHPLETAVLTGPLAYLGAPYNLNPPSQVPPVAGLLAPAFPEPEAAAQGMMVLGVLLGPFLASWCARRLFARTGGPQPKPPAQEERTPSVAVSEFARRETRVLALVLSLVALGFGAQALLLRWVPGLTEDHAPVVVLA